VAVKFQTKIEDGGSRIEDGRGDRGYKDRRWKIEDGGSRIEDGLLK
jgi:hypothetical protein